MEPCSKSTNVSEGHSAVRSSSWVTNSPGRSKAFSGSGRTDQAQVSLAPATPSLQVRFEWAEAGNGSGMLISRHAGTLRAESSTEELRAERVALG
jgi:hypothetical protein